MNFITTAQQHLYVFSETSLSSLSMFFQLFQQTVEQQSCFNLMVSKKSISSQLGGKKCDNPDKQKKSFTKVFVSFFLLNALEASISAPGNLVVNYFLWQRTVPPSIPLYHSYCQSRVQSSVVMMKAIFSDAYSLLLLLLETKYVACH